MSEPSNSWYGLPHLSGEVRDATSVGSDHRRDSERLSHDCRGGIVVESSIASNRVAAYMQVQGYCVIPVNPNETNVLGEPAYPSLAAVFGTIDLVNIFRKSEDVLPIVEETIAHGA